MYQTTKPAKVKHQNLLEDRRRAYQLEPSPVQYRVLLENRRRAYQLKPSLEAFLNLSYLQ